MKRNKYNYRKIYTQFYGGIPLDENGVSYDIHHIDGDKCNNNVNNLKALSIDEHYKIHLKQEDWGACKALSMRVTLPQKIKAELTRKFHLGRKRSQSTKDKISKANLGRKQSKFEREKRKFPRPGSGPQGPRSEETKLKMRKPKSSLGKSKKIIICPYCGKKGGEPIMKRWHFENCKIKKINKTL